MWSDFWFSRIIAWQVKDIAICLKIISQKSMAFVFCCRYPNQTFTKCVSNWYTHTNVWICQMWMQIMECLLILLRFLWVFSYIIDENSSLKTLSSPNLHRLCVWLIYTFWYVNMSNMTAGYWRFSYLFAFLGIFNILQHVWSDISLSNFYKLYIKAECRDEK